MNGPVLHVAAAPAAPATIPDLFRSDEVKRIIEQPPVTRHDGFNILTYEHAQIVEGERLVIETWRKRLELYTDGVFIALGTFSDLLGWPREGDEFAANPKINPLALIEFIYDFFKTYNVILNHVEPIPLPIRCQLGIMGAHSLSQPLWMAPHALHTIGQDLPRSKRQAPADAVSREIQVEAVLETPHIQAGQIAYALVEAIYNWFGLTSDTIPYASAQTHEIDPGSF